VFFNTTTLLSRCAALVCAGVLKWNGLKSDQDEALKVLALAERMFRQSSP
jgi:hypothetical protein